MGKKMRQLVEETLGGESFDRDETVWFDTWSMVMSSSGALEFVEAFVCILGVPAEMVLKEWWDATHIYSL